MVIMIVMVRNNKVLTSRHKKAPESFDSEALDHDYYIWVRFFELLDYTFDFENDCRTFG